MNKERRARLSEAQSFVSKAKDIVEDVQTEEEDVMYNMEEKFSGTEWYAQIESSVENLGALVEALDEVIAQFDSIED